MSDYKSYRSPVESDDGGFWLADLHASAYLVARGHKVGGIHYVGGSKYAFAFIDDKTLRRDHEHFCHDESMQDFVGAIGFLKALISDERKKTKSR